MLVAEVDRLEREVKELGREARRGVNVVHQLLEIIERDEKRVEVIERDTVKFTQELLEGETRKRFMTAAVNTVDAARLVQRMESKARSKLEEEWKIINQHKTGCVMNKRRKERMKKLKAQLPSIHPEAGGFA